MDEDLIKGVDLAKAVEWAQMQRWQSVFPYLEEANLRLISRYLQEAKTRHRYPAFEKNIKDEHRDEVREWFFRPSASPEERTIMVLADLVIALLFPEKIISGVICKAVEEIKEVYQVILQKGGGWSSKSDPDKRKTAALEWCDRHKGRLSYIKKSHLEDPALYYYGGRQEKRNFFNRLLLTIIKEVTHKKLTSQKIMDLLKGNISKD